MTYKQTIGTKFVAPSVEAEMKKLPKKLCKSNVVGFENQLQDARLRTTLIEYNNSIKGTDTCRNISISVLNKYLHSI